MSKVLITRSKLDGLATTIAAKSGAALPLTIAQMDAAVEGIDTSGINFVVTLSYNDQTEMWEPDCTYAELSAAAQAGKNIAVEIDGSTDTDASWENIAANWDWYNDRGINYFDYSVFQYNTATPENVVQTIYELSASELSVVDVATIVVPTGTKEITTNGTHNVASYASASVNVPTGTARTSADLTVSGATVTVPAGLYASQATKSVASGTAGTPTATKGTVSNHAISVTPSVTNQTGYITGGTKTGTAVSVSASELVSGNKSITANGNNIDVAEYATVSVNVSGSSKNVQVAQSTTRVANTAYTKAASLTCSVSGKYDVYWDCFRSTTSGTSGSQLYIGGSAYGSANTTFSSNIHAQSNHLTGVQINANQEVAVYVRSRATNYYAYCGQLTIVQTA